ncbi:DNA modification methylase [Litorimonas taeanensis]|uniref:site-specific DNA-methyltransferase (adenine-specific) n=1 Tax=Litorimonas taeanensis TaxID=568099 RepID=A0A420WD65_9PROT|nr:site-specific DNA-methyltransferase [Litorimonas taeanensis]RKQ68957.1 DNA modification methylase [Litorimonas taeanensis]
MKTETDITESPAPDTAPELSIVYRSVNALKPYDQNSRKHSKRNIEAIRTSLREYGFRKPIVIWRDNLILAGHGTVEAAKLEGIEEIPCADASHLDFTKARAFVIMDNKSSDLAGWNDDILKSELEALQTEADIDEDFDLSMLGFNDRELIKFLPDMDISAERRAATKTKSADPEIEAKDGPSIVRSGQIWHLGQHKLLCGSSIDPKNWTRLMAGAQAHLLFTDPPYGVSYSAKTADMNRRGVGGTQSQNEEIIENDALNAADLIPFLTDAFTAARAFMAEGGAYYVCMTGGSEGNFSMMNAMTDSGYPLNHQIIWVKNHIVLGRADYHYQHEVILYGWVKGSHKFYGPQNESTVWEFPKPQGNGLHPTMKPVALIERALRNSTKAGDIVIDGFGGSGSTLMACENRGRQARLIELSETYCDRILRRWRLATGEQPTLDGRPLSDYEAEYQSAELEAAE